MNVPQTLWKVGLVHCVYSHESWLSGWRTGSYSDSPELWPLDAWLPPPTPWVSPPPPSCAELISAPRQSCQVGLGCLGVRQEYQLDHPAQPRLWELAHQTNPCHSALHRGALNSFMIYRHMYQKKKNPSSVSSLGLVVNFSICNSILPEKNCQPDKQRQKGTKHYDMEKSKNGQAPNSCSCPWSGGNILCDSPHCFQSQPAAPCESKFKIAPYYTSEMSIVQNNTQKFTIIKPYTVLTKPKNQYNT